MSHTDGPPERGGRPSCIGILHEDEPIELIGGELMVAEPKGAPHYAATRKTAKARSDPVGRFVHPSRPVLTIEVAESSLAFDRRRKASLYARAGLPDYWVLEVLDATARVTPLALPEARIAVASFLP